MTFQTQTRKYEPLSEDDKYLIEKIGYRKQELKGQLNEDISRTTGGKVYTGVRDENALEGKKVLEDRAR